jgi:hypothetical protein
LRHQQLLLEPPVGQVHCQHAGKMVVTRAGPPERPRVR